ncbi:calcium/sodium antiporter [Stutzerimonas urumqiensis]|uniref:calcium/sodium antiporter n=1 Tax=Stutzerimonas urumqiensis TaxID=638269 RepID=UPI003DA6ACC7
MSALTLAYLIAGLGLLVLGAEGLVKGAAGLARRLGVSPLTIGLTVVALGTSAPEGAVSVEAALSGRGDIAVGNALGSCIANVLLILGLSALVSPLAVAPRLVRFDVPVMLGIGGLVFALALNGRLGSLEGAGLLAAIGFYTLCLLRRSRGTAPSATEAQEPARPPLANLLLALVGLGLLAAGSHLFIEGAVSVARALGLSERVIGLTLVAVGTSLPELATSLLAVLRGERDIAVGNIVGSNIVNLTLITGSAALVAPDGLSISPNALTFDFPVMLAVFAACVPIFLSGMRIRRWEGLLLCAHYLAYLLYLAMFSTGLGGFDIFRHAMTWFVLPATGTILIASGLHAWLSSRRKPPTETDS